MGLTPVEIRHLTFGRRLFGYRPASVDQTLTEVADSFEDVWRDRADLADKVESLENDLVRYREVETLLHTTLVSAERAAQELQEQARRESEVIVTEARAEARSITRQANDEHERLAAEIRRLKALLRSALETVEDAEDEKAAPEPGEHTDSWQDTDPGRWGTAA
jgi:cell division initiation protein